MQKQDKIYEVPILPTKQSSFTVQVPINSKSFDFRFIYAEEQERWWLEIKNTKKQLLFRCKITLNSDLFASGFANVKEFTNTIKSFAFVKKNSSTLQRDDFEREGVRLILKLK